MESAVPKRLPHMITVKEVHCHPCSNPGKAELSVKIPADPKILYIIRGVVEDVASHAGFSPQEKNQLVLAIDEISTNIIRHGYEGKTGLPIFYKFVAEKGRMEINIRDYGRKFQGPTENPADYKTPKLTPHGLGLILVHAIMDEVVFDTSGRRGTRYKLIKYKKSTE